MDPVVHFEMPYEDRKRMAKFYKSAFGWQAQMLGEEMGSYVLATTIETNEKGPTRPGAINGGFYPKRPDRPAQYPSIVIAVNDIKKAMGKVVKAGGTVLGVPMEIPGVGGYVSFVDPEGNRVSMLQPIPRSWHAPKATAKKRTVTKKAPVSGSGRSRKSVRRPAVKRS
jgi:predicted enzyme related to lactoylglutathione lyase